MEWNQAAGMAQKGLFKIATGEQHGFIIAGKPYFCLNRHATNKINDSPQEFS
jgi:hypothetical protein